MNQRELRQRLVEQFPRERTHLLPALHYVQHELGHLPDFALQVVGWHLHIPASEVYGAATSYTELRVEATGQHLVRVCTGLSCWLSGGDDLTRAARSALGVGPPETTEDGRVTLEETPCAFSCGVAPVVEVDGKLIGRVREDVLSATLSELRGMDGA